MTVPCAIPDCSKPASCRGWCRSHYCRWYRSGDPLPKIRTTADRYWENVDISEGPDACWPWTGGVNSRGYGTIWVEHRGWLAHRLGYTIQVGPIPEGHSVLHHCDNPPCQNSRHWFTGTRADNIADMIAKGRAVFPPPPPPGNFRRYGIRDREWMENA
jgi:hypothetical protein